MTPIDRDQVARYYIECELENIVTGDSLQLVDGLNSVKLARLLEALSFTYRANGVFDIVESGMYRWERRQIEVDSIKLGGMGETLTKYIYSEEIQRNPRKFIEFIKQHQHQAHFSELKTRIVPKNRQIILLREKNGKLYMLDGSHRLLSMMMNDVTSVEAYVAVIADKEARPMIGDATFLRLRVLWQHTGDAAFKQAIEQTVLGMMAASSDGIQSVQSYWIAMAPNERVRRKGQELIERLNNSGNIGSPRQSE